MDDSEIISLDSLESIHWWYLNRKHILAAWLAKMPSNSKILDLGSASGGNTVFMRALGFEVTSVELTDVGISIQELKGLSPIKADARELPFPNSSFDLVVCLDVIEHIEEHEVVLNEIHRITRVGGHILLSVPEDPTMWSDHDRAVNHVRRYTSFQLREVVESGGFQVSRLFSTNFVMKPWIRLRRRRTSGSSLTKPTGFENWVMRLVGKIETRLLFLSIPGVTLWIEAKKIG